MSPLLWLFLWSICALAHGMAGEEASVTTAQEFIAALSIPDTDHVYLQGDIKLVAGSANLPVVIGARRSVVIASAPGAGRQWSLDVSAVLQLLQLESGSSLSLEELRLEGVPSQNAGRSGGLAVEVPNSPIWPTVSGDDGHQVSFREVDVTRYLVGCTPSYTESLASALRLVGGGNGSSVAAGGNTITIPGPFTYEAAIVSLETKAQVGTARYAYKEFTATCLKTAGIEPAGPNLDPNNTYSHAIGSADGSQAEEVLVGTAGQLLEALNRSGVGWVGLQGDIIFGADDTAGYQMPFFVEPNTSLTISSDGGAQRLLSFGNMLQFLYMAPESSLLLANLDLSGFARSWQGIKAGLPTQLPASPLWPTLDGAQGHEVEVVNCTVHLVANNCSQTQQYVAQAVRQKLGRNGTVVELSGNTLLLNDSYTDIMPVLDTMSKAAEGNATLRFTNVIFVCEEVVGEGDSEAGGQGQEQQPMPSSPPPSQESPSSSSGSSSGGGGGGGSPDWLWPVVGSVVGVVVVAAAAAAVWAVRRRHHRLVHEEAPTAGAASAKEEGGEHVMKSSTPAHTSWVSNPRGSLGGEPMMIGATSPSASANLLWGCRVGPVEGLELGELLGRGSFGKCYRGRWQGAIVAVKIVEHVVVAGRSHEIGREPLLSLSCSHPNVVSVFRSCLVCVHRTDGAGSLDQAADSAHDSPSGSQAGSLGQASGLHGSYGSTPQEGRQGTGGSKGKTGSGGAAGGLGSGSGSGGGRGSGAAGSMGSGKGSIAGGTHSSRKRVPALSQHSAQGEPPQLLDVFSPQDDLPPGIYETWMVCEYCERGNLTDAITQGKFYNSANGEMDMPATLLSLLDVALGLTYLHGVPVVHGDIKGRNVLLKAARVDRRGYVCKLADFGLSRMLNQGQTHIDTHSHGTATHAAPELLRCNTLSPAADVYSFAVIVWEMVSGQEVYADMTSTQIILAVTQHQYRPPIPDHCPPGLAALMQRCWDEDPKLRPAMDEVVAELREMLKMLRRMSIDQPPGKTSTPTSIAFGPHRPG